jgi:hypothetical protein
MRALKKGVWHSWSGDGVGSSDSVINWWRHQPMCPPGMWLVDAFMPSLQFSLPKLLAVVDDFGNLVQVGVLHG